MKCFRDAIGFNAAMVCLFGYALPDPLILRSTSDSECVSKDVARTLASWFETRLSALLTMRR
jgi:hypothetical protein